MKCPFCPEDSSQDFLSEGDLGHHIARAHPEKILTPQAMAQEMARVTRLRDIYGLAATLTIASLGGKGGPKLVVLERFRFFVKEIFKLYGEETHGKRG